MLLNDFANRGYLRPVVQKCLLGDLEGLTVRIEQPLERFSLMRGVDSDALLLPDLGVAPDHHEGRRAVLFDAFPDTSHIKMLVPCQQIWGFCQQSGAI